MAETALLPPATTTTPTPYPKTGEIGDCQKQIAEYSADDGEDQVRVPCWLLPLGRLCVVPLTRQSGRLLGASSGGVEGLANLYLPSGGPHNSSQMSTQLTQRLGTTKGQVGQPALVREAAVTAEQITQQLGRESDIVPSPLPPGHTSLEVVLIIRKPAPACISEFEVLNYLLINPEIREWDRDGGRERMGEGGGQKLYCFLKGH